MVVEPGAAVEVVPLLSHTWEEEEEAETVVVICVGGVVAHDHNHIHKEIDVLRCIGES